MSGAVYQSIFDTFESSMKSTGTHQMLGPINSRVCIFDQIVLVLLRL